MNTTSENLPGVNVQTQSALQATKLESTLIQGDLSKLTTEERASYYLQVCNSLGLNHLTKPFDYIPLGGKLTLYAKRDATDQLRNLRNVSVEIVARDKSADMYAVTARARMPNGRTDESIGAVSIAKLTGEHLANAIMKAETKAKRRVTLSICGLGILDEIEVDSIHQTSVSVVKPPVPALVTGEKLVENKELKEAIRMMFDTAKAAGWSAEKLREHIEFGFGRGFEGPLNGARLIEAGITMKEVESVMKHIDNALGEIGTDEDIEAAKSQEFRI